MDRLLLVAALTILVAGAALIVRKARPSAESSAAAGSQGWPLPQHLDPADFGPLTAPWWLAVFTSATCATCASMKRDATALASDDLAVIEVEFGARADLHRKYGIEAVPALAVVDRTGGVHRWVLGPVTAAELREAVGAEQAISIRPPDGRERP